MLGLWGCEELRFEGTIELLDLGGVDSTLKAVDGALQQLTEFARHQNEAFEQIVGGYSKVLHDCAAIHEDLQVTDVVSEVTDPVTNAIHKARKVLKELLEDFSVLAHILKPLTGDQIDLFGCLAPINFQLLDQSSLTGLTEDECAAKAKVHDLLQAKHGAPCIAPDVVGVLNSFGSWIWDAPGSFASWMWGALTALSWGLPKAKEPKDTCFTE